MLILVAILPVWLAVAPWPAALLVGGLAMERGRVAGLAAAGVFAGSALWAALALAGSAAGLLAGPVPDVLRIGQALVPAGLGWISFHCARGGA